MIYILFIDPYTPYEVNVSAVTDAGIGEPLYKVFFTKEIGKTYRHKYKKEIYSKINANS